MYESLTMIKIAYEFEGEFICELYCFFSPKLNFLSILLIVIYRTKQNDNKLKQTSREQK